MYQTSVLAVLLCGLEASALNETDIGRLQEVEMGVLWKMTSIEWNDLDKERS